jgi:predicted MFS family arabinose efflux permease
MDDCVSDCIRRRIRYCLPGLRRICHARRQRREAGRGLRRDLAAFDTGIGTGSTSMGWIIQHFGFRSAFGVAATISALALPYFLVMDRTLRGNR